ncbi:SGNH hydrolase domain-containing protein [Brevundimonas sp.]|uniref:SGNH hydrolase domain-containing protein n=1 Tax=Brevundimonas sp. TaxID=1871086 RepID=UPI002D2375FB|nr:SGNH hydrolase domain-containing protein [Brevundimonas sp.]HYC96923.1 SGNH hydrolase domain-containing protein [Brevundimonas sp.]
MPIAPEDHPGAVHQTRWAALCFAAVAVLALAAFHAAPEQAWIGQSGFHLALALAGFAITDLTIAAPEERTAARLLGVWGRAAAWAVPAVVVVVAAVLMAGLALLPPADLRNQGWTALWTALGNSGAELLKQGAYTPRSSSELLLHGWLIGVAAQLAPGWSAILVLMRRLGLARWIVIAAVLGLAASLALDLFMRRQGLHPAAFYLAPPRAWPFLAGALAALIARRPGRPAPGWAIRPLEGLARFGVVALPFYLWSWPLLALPGLILARPLSLPEAALALAVAALLALATHRWIETPVRRRLEGRPIRALIFAAAALGATGAAGATLFALHGLPGRASAAVRAEEAGVLRRPPLQALCHTEGHALPAADRCTVPAGADVDVVLWGNSHADHLSPAVLAWAGGRGLGVRQATRSGCLPLLRARAPLTDEGCRAFNRAAVAEWGRAGPEVVLLGAAWTLILERSPGDPARNLDAVIEDLARTVRALRSEVGPRTLIVLLGTTPDYGFAPGACHARRAFLGLDTGRCDLAAPANAELAAMVDARLAALAAAEPGVTLYRPRDALCEGARCRTRGGDGPWYSDRSHMTAAGGAIQRRALQATLDAHVRSAP